jgi:hypothetical protein
MKDRIRELLFPLTILAIVGSLYTLARAQAFEKMANDEGRPLVHDVMEYQPVAAIDGE